MASRYRSLAVYSGLLATASLAWLVHDLSSVDSFPPVWGVAFCVVTCLFVWHFGLTAPRVGLISMERVPQIGLLLIFSPAVAAAICATASFLWPLISRKYSQGSTKVASLRAVHNAAMTALMLMLAGKAYLAVGGRAPLEGLLAQDIWPIVVMAIVTQIVNICLMALFFRFDGREVRAIITPVYALSDLIFVPAGVLAAVLYNMNEPAVFATFAGLMIVFVMSFHSIGDAMTAAQSERGPMSRLFETRPLRGARRIDDLAERILTETRALVRFDEFYLVLVDRDERILDLRLHERGGSRMPVRSKRVDSGLFGWVAERAQPLLIEAWSGAPEDLRRRADSTGKETGSLIVVPLIEEGVVIGLLSVQHTAEGVYSEADLHLMRQLADQVAPAMADARAFEDLEDYRRRLEDRVAERTVELEKANGEKERLITAMRERSLRLERESLEDSLTGVANRRGFTQRLSAEMEVALAVGQPLCLAVADLDHFKVINDRLGHLVGDKALYEIARIMRAQVRTSDLVARIGGEEFAIVLPAMTRAAGMEFCETLRGAVELHAWSAIQGDLAVTLSIGLSQWDGSADVSDLLRAADQQLYKAKRAGRNQVAA